ncbi:GroES-like protein [Wilcoxina mikolae CBS 423.85]|nr:GroES-like protein [Wilcoxina mikolae CBS 423.85]
MAGVGALRGRDRRRVGWEPAPLPPPLPTELQIAIRSTTLCGSDLHYYNHYRNGDIHVTTPFSLGHESSGIVVSVGSSITTFTPGDRVALEVGIPCGACPLCLSGCYNICPTLRFRGSAKSTPHFWGTLQERINHPAAWYSISFTTAALLEPLSVALHATHRTQRNASLSPGSRVLVIGAGAVGLLVAATATLAGAARVCIADINAGRVALRRRRAAAEGMLEAAGCEEGVDVVFECTGMEQCVQAGIFAARPGGTLMLIGMGNPVMTLPISAAALREVDIMGGFRYANTYARGIEVLESGRLGDVEKLVTQRFVGLERVGEAFEMAGRKTDDGGALVVKVEVRLEG